MPITVLCASCGKNSSVRPPAYRCEYCNYPLKSMLEGEVYDRKAEPKQAKRRRNLDDQVRSRRQEEEGAYGLGGGRSLYNQQQAPTLQYQLIPNFKAKQAGRNLMGWLIVHMQNRPKVAFEVFDGESVISKANPNYYFDIALEDERVSRGHAVLYGQQDTLNRKMLILKDDGSKRNGNPSSNGTFINGYAKRIPKNGQIFLRDGDTVQVGYTVLVFISNELVDNIDKAIASMASMDYPNVIS